MNVWSYRGAEECIEPYKGYAEWWQGSASARKKAHRCFVAFTKSSANAMDRGLELHRPGARTLQHMPIPVAEILNTEGPGARTLQRESLYS